MASPALSMARKPPDPTRDDDDGCPMSLRVSPSVSDIHTPKCWLTLSRPSSAEIGFLWALLLPVREALEPFTSPAQASVLSDVSWRFMLAPSEGNKKDKYEDDDNNDNEKQQ